MTFHPKLDDLEGVFAEQEMHWYLFVFNANFQKFTFKLLKGKYKGSSLDCDLVTVEANGVR